MRKQNETSEERAASVSRIAASKQARISILSEEECILRQQKQREQKMLRVQALRQKEQQIVALQSSVEPNAVNAENCEGERAFSTFTDTPISCGDFCRSRFQDE